MVMIVDWQVPEGIKIRGLLLSFFLLWSTIARHQILKLLRLRFFVLESLWWRFFFLKSVVGTLGCSENWVYSWLVGCSSDDSRNFQAFVNNKKDFSVILSKEFLETEPNISVSPFFPLPKIHDQKLLEFRHFGKSKLIRWTLQGSLGKRETVQRLDIGP